MVYAREDAGANEFLIRGRLLLISGRLSVDGLRLARKWRPNVHIRTRIQWRIGAEKQPNVFRPGIM